MELNVGKLQRTRSWMDKSVLNWSLDKHSVLPLNCSEPLGRKSAGAVGRNASREELGVEPRDRAREVRGAAIEARLRSEVNNSQ